MHYETRYCTHCATPLQWVIQAEDGGDVSRLRCPECGWTHWNNPTPVLAAIVELDGKVLLARNAAWPEKVFGLITGFMEAGESPEEGVAREVAEETGLQAESLEKAERAYDFAVQRYKAGLASQVTVLNTETQVITQRRLDVDLRARALDTRVSLMKALGGGWTDGTAAVQVSQH